MENEKYKGDFNYYFDDIETLQDKDDRYLLINDQIDDYLIQQIVCKILRYNKEDENLPIEKRKPIILRINSCGGYVTTGYAIIDAIITSKTPVYTVNLGLCASMAFLVFIAGHKRFSMPHAEYLLHDGSTMGMDSTAKIKDRIEFETGKLAKSTKDFVLSKTKITKNMYEKNYRVEWYFLPDEAKKYGIVDYIIGEDCDINDIL